MFQHRDSSNSFKNSLKIFGQKSTLVETTKNLQRVGVRRAAFAEGGVRLVRGGSRAAYVNRVARDLIRGVEERKEVTVSLKRRRN